MTQQRQIILEELRNVNTHPSAEELYEMVRQRLPHISLATVYRNLEILSASGEIQKLEPSCRLSRFDGVAADHYHIRCLDCDRVIDAPPGFDVRITHNLSEQTGFKIIGHQLEFIGFCHACLNHSQSC
jgi:Fur family ferric uptake transcriptional regulator